MIRKPAMIMAAVATAVCIGIPVLSGTAQASGTFQITSDSSPYYCMQEDGTSSGLYLDPCGSNSSDYWESYSGDSYEYENAHSHLCITWNGTDESVELLTCYPASPAQEWYIMPANGVNPPEKICLLDDSTACIWQSVKSAVVRDSFDPSNVHDLWNL